MALMHWTSSIGLVAALVQLATMAVQYANTRSVGILCCLIAAALYGVAYIVYWRHLRRPASSSSPFSKAGKYFLISHLLVSTWYFWISLMTFLFHTADTQIFAALTDGRVGSAAKGLIAAFFAVTVLSHCIDAYTIIFHTRHLRGQTTFASGVSIVTTDRPRYTAVGTLVVDVALITMSGVSYSQTHDHGTIALILLGVASLLLQARYCYRAWTLPDVDVRYHIDGQLLHLQHELVNSTVFLVNFMLLLLGALSMSLSSIIAQDTANEGAQIVVSIVAYALIAVTTVILVAQHTRMDDPAVAQAFDAAAFHAQTPVFTWGATNPAAGVAEYHAVPVALSPAQTFAMPVPLRD